MPEIMPSSVEKFALQEHASLRAEILLLLGEAYNLERNILIAVGAIWGFLLTHQPKGVDKLAWFIPILFTFLAHLRAIRNMHYFARFGDYLNGIENQFYGSQGGWEQFYKNRVLHNHWLSGRPFWVILYAATVSVAFYKSCLA